MFTSCFVAEEENEDQNCIKYSCEETTVPYPTVIYQLVNTLFLLINLSV